MGLFGKSKKDKTAASVIAVGSEQPIPNRREVIAAVSAAIAEELGESVNNIRIHSFKRV